MKNKLGAALISICVAFGLWLYVISTVSPESEATISGIPVVLEGETILNERGLMITGQDELNVSLKLSGNRKDLSRVNKGNITIKVDLSKIYETGKTTLQYLPIFPGDVPSNAFVIENKYPESVTVNVDERRNNKEVPVEMKWVGATPTGFMSDKGNAELDNPVVLITGPASVADQIEKAVVEVNLDGQKESISDSFRYTLCDKDGNPVDAEQITTNVEQVRLDLKIVRFKDLQLSYNLVEGGGANAENTTITPSAETIRVSGSETALEAMGDQLVIGTVNLRDIPKDDTLTYPVILPEGVNNLTGVTEVKLEIKFNGLTSKEFTIEDIHAVHVPEGMKADIIAEKIPVVIRGPAAVLNSIDEKQLGIELDLASAELGTSTYKGAVIFPEDYHSCGAMGTVSASATVTKSK